MKGSNQTRRFFVLFSLLLLAISYVGAQKLGPEDIDPTTEDTRCIEENYRHKTAQELSRMTPEQLIDESEKEWNYHVALLDEYGMFTLSSYTSKIGLAVLPVVTRLAGNFAARPRSKCQQERFFTAFAIASDVDNQIVRLRTRIDGQKAIAAAALAIQRMKEAGLADHNAHPYNKYEFGMFMLDEVGGVNEHDNLMRELLKKEFGLELPEDEFRSFVAFLTSTHPTYPSWTPHVNGSRNLRPNKKKYHNAYLQFKKTVRTADSPSSHRRVKTVSR